MGSPIIWFGEALKALKNKLTFQNDVSIQTGSLDPTASAVDASEGSLYISTSTGLTYRKTDSGSSTNWSGLSGVTEFTQLTDLATAIVPTDVYLTSETSFRINMDDGTGNFSACEANVGNALMFSQDNSNQSFVQCNADGKLELRGTQSIYTATNQNPLEPGAAFYVFTSDPGANVEVDATLIYNNFNIINDSGVTITIEGAGAETFNGSATINISDGQSAKFVASQGLVDYFVTFSGAPATSPVLAWVNFDGTGTPAIRSDFNVSSIGDDGQGRYIINYDTALADDDYSFTSNAALAGTRIHYSGPLNGAGGYPLSTTAGYMYTVNDLGNAQDSDVVCVTVTGNQ